MEDVELFGEEENFVGSARGGRRRERAMACRASSRLPFLIVSHEAVVVRAEEWLTTKKDSKHGDNLSDKRGDRGEKGESSSSMVGALLRSGSSPTAAAKLLDVEMLSEEILQPLSPSFKLDGLCDPLFIYPSFQSPSCSTHIFLAFPARRVFLFRGEFF